MLGLIAKKIGMSRVFREDGTAVPVTYLEVKPNTVVRTRKRDRDGYDAIVLGIEPRKRTSRKGKERTQYRMEREFIVDSLEEYAVGAQLNADVIPEESMVTVCGVSKGKGFAGVIKRHHFSSGPETHGSHHHREPGSVGTRAKPGRVNMGKKLPGRMGGERTTIKHRAVVISDSGEGILAVKGPVPGPEGSFVCVTLEPALS